WLVQAAPGGRGSMVLHEVITAERVLLHYRVAGMGSRFIAWLLDACLIILLMLIGFAMGVVLAAKQQGVGIALFALWGFVVQWGYFILFEWLWQGQTPGKRLLGLRVIRWQGTSVSFTQSVIRNVLRVADGLPLPVVDFIPFLYGLGFVVAACNRENRR